MITFKDFFSFKKNRFFWINIIAMFAVFVLLIWGTLFGLDLYTHHGEAVEVPDLKNKSLQEARLLLENRELEGIVVDSTYTPGESAGRILDQTPAAQSLVKKGRTIYLTISSHKVPFVKIPDLIDNSSYRQAEAKLRAMGFRLTEPKMVAGEQDWVYDILFRGRSVRTGEKVPYEATLTLCIGNSAMRDSLATDSLLQEGGADDVKVDDDWF